MPALDQHTGDMERNAWDKPSVDGDDGILPTPCAHPVFEASASDTKSRGSSVRSASIPVLNANEMSSRDTVTSISIQSHMAHFFFVILPLALVTAVITADMSNLEFVHLVQLQVAVPPTDRTLPADSVLHDNLLRWTFLQSAYLLPIMLFAGAVLILQFVLLVARLRHSRLADGLSATLALTVLVVGVTTLLNAWVGTAVVGIILTKMLSAGVVCGALGLVAIAVELLPPQQAGENASADAAVGFSTVTFGTVYGLGTALASGSTVAGYQLARLLQRCGIRFEGTGSGPAHGFRGVFVLEGLFFLVLCPVICILLLLSRRLRRSSHPTSLSESDMLMLQAVQPLHRLPEAFNDVQDCKTSDASHPPTAKLTQTDLAANQGIITTTTAAISDESGSADELASGGDDKDDKTMFASLRRFSSYCTSLGHISVLQRSNGGTSSVAANMRTLQRFHSGFGLWVSSVLRRVMVWLYGRMGVDDAAFDLISAGTSSRETFICGVLIVSNTVIIQLAVISLIAPLKAPDGLQTAAAELKVVPTLPGLPTLAGGVSGGISSIVWSVWATKRVGRGRPWWVPALLTACLVITLAGLGLAVVASIMVPQGTCGPWIVYAATVVTYAGSTPQLPLALLQIYTVLDAELGRNPAPDAAYSAPAATDTDASEDGAPRESATADVARRAARTPSASVQAVRWERVGVMISTLTTIAGSELLTAWVFLMPDAAQKAFLFTSAVLAIGGSVWLMFRHTWPLRQQRKLARQSLKA